MDHFLDHVETRGHREEMNAAINFGCPNEGSVLEYYNTNFSHVFIVLHPFFIPKSISIEQFAPRTYPNNRQITRDCAPVSWAEVLEQSKFTDLQQLDLALRSSFGGLYRGDSRLSGTLEAMLDAKKWLPPEAGLISPFVERDFLTALLQLGYSNFLVADEFGDRTIRKGILEFIESGSLPAHGSMTTEDHEIFLTTHWDSHSSFLCCNAPDLFPELEKLPCSERTQVYWGLYPL